MKNTVYILTGPAGVGKSTISTQLVEKFSHSAYISGDYISHMHVNGRQKPWESEEETALIWKNIMSLARNFLTHENDVVIDYVAFPHEADWVRESLQDFEVEVKYVVLWTDEETLMKRDQMRAPENQMGERCLALFNEFKASGLDDKHVLNTNMKTTETIIEEIINEPKYKLI